MTERAGTPDDSPGVDLDPSGRVQPDSAAMDHDVVRMTSWLDRPWGTPWAGHDEIIRAADLVTEIGRSENGCLGTCPVYTVVLRRQGPAEYNGQYFVERLGTYKADFEPGAFDDLARAVMFTSMGPPAERAREQARIASERAKARLVALLDSLPERERRILRLRFGLEDGRPRTREEIGRELNMSADLVGQIGRAALRGFGEPSLPSDLPSTTGWANQGNNRLALSTPAPSLIDALVYVMASQLDWRSTTQEPGSGAFPWGAPRWEPPPWEPLSPIEGTGETCPMCGIGTLMSKRGRFGTFLGCDRYPECGYIRRGRNAG